MSRSGTRGTACPNREFVHGAGDPSLVDAAPEGADIALQGLGWASAHESGFGEHTITSGIEGSWVNTPTQWSENYFRLLLDYDYELVKSPAGAQQWQPINQRPEDMKIRRAVGSAVKEDRIAALQP